MLPEVVNCFRVQRHAWGALQATRLRPGCSSLGAIWGLCRRVDVVPTYIAESQQHDAAGMHADALEASALRLGNQEHQRGVGVRPRDAHNRGVLL